MVNVPRVSVIQRRLAAYYHRRQSEVIDKGIALGERVSSLVKRYGDRIVEELRKTSFVLKRVGDLLDVMTADLVDRIFAEFVLYARDAWRSAVDSVINAVGVEVLAAFLLSAQREASGLQAWVRSRYELAGVPPDEIEDVVRSVIFPQPSAEDVHRWLTVAVPGGLSWDRRLRAWAKWYRDFFLNEIVIGISSGENPDQIEKRLRPAVNGLAYKSERIARTESCRIAERANLAMCESIAEYIEGQQIVAVMDEWTRPHHAARNGKIFYRSPDGVYRDREGKPLPDLPDEPNCRCMTIPVMKIPEVLRRNRDAWTVFRTAAGDLIPDPASYLDWWSRATERQRKIAVGVKRYNVMREILKRPPKWEELIDRDGQLLPVDVLRGESVTEREERVAVVRNVIAERTRAFKRVISHGFGFVR